MKFKIRVVFFCFTKASKNMLSQEYGDDFYRSFKKLSKQYLEEMIPNVPDIGRSVFETSYVCAPAYFAWYKALIKLNISKKIALNLIWQINEEFLKKFPKEVLYFFAKSMYLGSFRKQLFVVWTIYFLII